jgi:hypothetical protein
MKVDTTKIFVTACFMDSGKQNYIVKYGHDYSFHQTIADFRREEIRIPQMSNNEKGRIERNPNVFKLWAHDTENVIEACFASDMEYWKLSKFVKD